MLSNTCGDVGTLVGTLVGTAYSRYLRVLCRDGETVPTVPTLFLIPTGRKAIFARNTGGDGGDGGDVGTVSQKPCKSCLFSVPTSVPTSLAICGGTGCREDL